MTPGSQAFMARAIEMAIDNVRTGSGGPFGALVVKDGAVMASGVNLVTSSNDPTAHAEIVAIRAACRALGSFQLTGCDIYATCEPCPMCLGAIYWARPARVFYAATRADAADAGFDDSLIYEELTASLTARRIPMLPLLRGEAQRIFDAWRSRIDRRPY
ncbi:MAG TPA: nucleoside deaminase [Bryobacteraceae bacterium]|nr:nucleoside deaminase [Bryobacteraceae bacterium]